MALVGDMINLGIKPLSMTRHREIYIPFAQVRTLRATPKELVPAQGAGRMPATREWGGEAPVCGGSLYGVCRQPCRAVCQYHWRRGEPGHRDDRVYHADGRIA